MNDKIGWIRSVHIGKSVPYTRKNSFSAINKHKIQNPIQAGFNGLEGDERGEPAVHGGLDQALHCYPHAHYQTWQSEFPDIALFKQAGAFGENLSVAQIDEENVCIGDKWRVGSAIFEISQGRQPCWKLNDRFGISDMSKRVQNTIRCGWYLRVLVEGQIQESDEIIRIAQPHPNGSIAHLMRTIRDRNCDLSTLEEILTLPLTPSWKKLFERRLETGLTEQWQERLEGENSETAHSG